jgi:lysophospholipase L1-like esterase
LNSDTRLVTLTVGAANLGLSAVAAACLPTPTQQCEIAILNAQGPLGDCPGAESQLGRDLTDLYAKVADAAPRARIVVTGYPLLFEPPNASTPKNTAEIITAVNEATTTLNCVIERSVAMANDADINIHYVDVTEEFAGHGIVIGSTKQDFIYTAGPEAFHPTAEGYRAYAAAISAALPGGWLKTQEPLT